MIIGYVSDEYDVALAGVELVFRSNHGNHRQQRVVCRSDITGAVSAELEDGSFDVALGKAGYGSKRVAFDYRQGAPPHRFRLISDRMYGYMWPKWVRAGESGEYCVHSAEPFRLELWRYGWRKQRVRSLGWCDEHAPRAMAQITPDGDYTQSGVQWNRTGYTLQYQKHRIAAPEVSGLYFLHAQARSGDFCAFPWIVSPQQPTARIAVVSSTLTQNAYNRFGGRSNYYCQDGLLAQPIVNSRQDVGRYTNPDLFPYEDTAAPLSFMRPEPAAEIAADAQITDPIPGRMGSCFAPGEWRLLGWLEREGFAYDLYSETDLHFGRLPLDQYRVLLLNNHSEYWTGKMYHCVKDWVHQNGGRLLYPGGCALYAELEFDDEHTVRYRQEGRWDQRGESAAKLLGIEYTHGGFQSGAPYRVLQPDHWAFAGCGLAEGDCFGFESLHERCPGGASAHELDKTSADSPAELQILAKGQNPDDSGAELSYYQTPSGGAVFSAGSLTWTLALPIDHHVSRITANVLRRFL